MVSGRYGQRTNLSGHVGVLSNVVLGVSVRRTAGVHTDHPRQGLRGVASVLNRRVANFQEDTVLGVPNVGFPGCHAEELGVEQVDSRHERVLGDVVRVIELVLRDTRLKQLLGRKITDRVFATGNQPPELVQIAGTRDPDRHTDNGNGLKHGFSSGWLS